MINYIYEESLLFFLMLPIIGLVFSYFFSHFKLSCCGTIENRCPDAEKDTRVRPRAALYKQQKLNWLISNE